MVGPKWDEEHDASENGLIEAPSAVLRVAAALPTGVIPSTVSAQEIADRLAKHAHKARGAYAPETVRAMAKGSAAWFRWCAGRDACGLPTSPDVLAEYVDALAAQGRKVSGIRQAVWAVGALHRATRFPDPATDEAVRLALKRVARAYGSRQRQAAPIVEDDERMILRLAGKSPRELRDVALLLVMRDLLARRSEVVALQVEDLTFARDGTATALIRRSKTDQGGQGKVLWLGPATVARLRAWMSAAAITTGPVFRAVNKAGVPGHQLDAGSVPGILKRLAELAGLDPETISGHSCRVGMAQDLSASGADVARLMEAGRWKSPMMPARYTERQEAARGAVAMFRQRRG
ncbi:DNA integration/recombination/inversion protein (plasmid) [Roseomonas mucosa]|uniref:DNA integration/recombination/inversion protein n=1 Tax=Roseomonas mucosa TaxID=207340 RepID=A0A4Y1MSH3_9PROT|nr:site-specific integrase [Roseomonas mucosa]AWV20630.1 DNA integration/recombination/inversion protein [Roseomonas mucosa]QDJ12320.1 DNA integration/recombination/inversion protein [Roseomonas mucosa]